MDPIDQATLNMLDLKAAAAAEAAAWRNLLPPEPWLEIVGRRPDEFAEYTRFILEAGAAISPSVVTRARKQHQQTRPVPIVGIAERIAFRALCDRALLSRDPADRTQDAYQRFIAGPISFAYSHKSIMRVSDAKIGYVIESDIAAFYEYVDHSRLLEELQLRTSTVALPRYLVSLLAEIQGRPFGLPQLLGPSDELSELYARIVERELRRKDIEVWRYNDDFRLAATSYDEAQSHVEALAREASAVGLILNEAKTRIVKFANYFWKNWSQPRTEGDVEFKPELLKMESDYGELDADELAQVAHDTLARLRLGPGEPKRLDPSKLSSDDSHALGRAIGILTRQADAGGLPHVVQLFEFASHLGHRLGAYLVSLHKSGTDVGPTWDALAGRSDVFNAWQRIWLVYIARACQLMSDATRRAWVQQQSGDRDQLLRAEATLTLAPHGVVSFSDVDRAVRLEPGALMPWYALAAAEIPNVGGSQIQALKASHRLIELLLHKP